MAASIIKKIGKRREMGVLLGLIIMTLFFAIVTPQFTRVINILNIIRQVSLTGIMAMGMSLVILLGEIDLSAGAVYFFSGVTCALMVTNGFPFLLAILVGLVSGILFGLASGFLVAKIGLPSFIATLGMTNVARGLGQTISKGVVIALTPNSVKVKGLELFTFFGVGKVGNVFPMLAICFLVTGILTWYLVHGTVFGFRLKAVGGNMNASKVMGLHINRIKIIVFMLEGLAAALAGILGLAWLGSVQGTTGEGMELDAIAAVIIGGTSTTGGEGSIIGTTIGVLIMGVLKNGLVLLGVTSFIQTVIVGLVVIGSVAVDILATRRKR